MLVTKPNRDADFRCLASSCPDTCCAGWEIVVDEESAARFRAMEGELGERMRAALITVDGEAQLRRREDGRCVLLNENNLCDLHAACGEGALCRTCRLHPRFVADYGARREVMPGLSCPAWIETYLLDEERVTFITEETGDPIGYTDIDAALFFKLYRARAQAIEMLQDRSLTIAERLHRLLTLAAELDSEREEDCSPNGILPAYRKKLALLEILTLQWRELLRQKGGTPYPEAELAPLLEKVLVYDVFRFFLRGVYDGRALPWAKYAVFHALVLRRLSRHCASKKEICEVIRLYSKEIEHNAENQEALHRTLCRRSGRWSMTGLLKAMDE
ncbi:MAG: hypothetical protein E7469_07895 [Ruminococcaceae bacterium]|nr:hypothetical protein [Oscillospiraceae bacterium]